MAAFHPFPWRQGDVTKNERPWLVLDAKGRIVTDCCNNDPKQTMDEACQRARAIADATARI